MLTHKQTIGAIVITLALYALTSLLTGSDAEAIRIERMRQSKQDMDMLSGQIRTLTEDYRHAESCYKANSQTGTLVECVRGQVKNEEKPIVVDTKTPTADDVLMGKICKHGALNGKTSPLCNNWELYRNLKTITEERLGT